MLSPARSAGRSEHPGKKVLIGLSGRGDKDMPTLQRTVLADRQPSNEMTPSEKISAAIREARGGTAIVAFVTAGYPLREKFREHLTQIGNEADVVEIGVPFTDPMADGMTIQRSSREALRQGVSLRWLLEELAAMQRHSQLPRAPLVLMSYLNPLLAFGFDEARERVRARPACAASSFRICPTMKARTCAPRWMPHGLALIQMVTPVTTPARMAQALRRLARVRVRGHHDRHHRPHRVGAGRGHALSRRRDAPRRKSPCAPASASAAASRWSSSRATWPASSSAPRWSKCSRTDRMRQRSCESLRSS